MSVREWRYGWIDDLEAWGEKWKAATSLACFIANLATFFLRGLMLQMLLGRGLPVLGAAAVTISIPVAALAAMLVAGVITEAPDQFKPTPIYSAMGGVCAALFNTAFLAVVLWVAA